MKDSETGVKSQEAVPGLATGPGGQLLAAHSVNHSAQRPVQELWFHGPGLPETPGGWEGRLVTGMWQREERQTTHCGPGQAVGSWCPPSTPAAIMTRPSPPPTPQLEVTADLAERRRIRSAIRELQRQELQREEEALASKRFRAERQDNKENWLQ